MERDSGIPTSAPAPAQALSIEGGGSCAAATVGFLSKCDLSQLKYIAGTSSGAIIATLLAVGYTPEEIRTSVLKPFNIMRDMLDFHPAVNNKLRTLWRVMRQGSLNDGKKLWRYFGRLVADKCDGNADITFREAFKKTGIQIMIVATCVNLPRVEVFSSITTPKTPLRSALMASVAIPILMSPVVIDGNIYVDGGLTCNNPCRLMCKTFPVRNLRICEIRYDQSAKDVTQRVWSTDVMPNIWNVILVPQYRMSYLDDELRRHELDESYTIDLYELPSETYSGFSLLSADDCLRLYNEGAKYAPQTV